MPSPVQLEKIRIKIYFFCCKILTTEAKLKAGFVVRIVIGKSKVPRRSSISFICSSYVLFTPAKLSTTDMVVLNLVSIDSSLASYLKLEGIKYISLCKALNAQIRESTHLTLLSAIFVSNRFKNCQNERIYRILN